MFMLMKLTPEVNSRSVLCTALTPIDPKNTKATEELTVIFALLGSVSVKALNKTLMKLTP